MSDKHGILTHRESWHTSPKWIERVRATMRTIDPAFASSAQVNKVVKTTTFFDAESNSLAQKWFGRVFLNPPYTRGSQKNSSLTKTSAVIL